jgi:hypothetical protein
MVAAQGLGNPLSDKEIHIAKVVSRASDTDELKCTVRAVNPKERLSAYSTILAAAFGLISDGCEYYDHPCLESLSPQYRPEQHYDNV